MPSPGVPRQAEGIAVGATTARRQAASFMEGGSCSLARRDFGEGHAPPRRWQASLVGSALGPSNAWLEVCVFQNQEGVQWNLA